MKDDERDLAARLAGLTPASRPRDASAVRKAIRRTFDAITQARGRGVTWQQIAETLAADVVQASDSTVPTEHEVRTLFHAERYARGGKRQRRRKGEAPAVTPPSPRPAKAPPAPPPLSLAEEEADTPPSTSDLFRPAAHKGTST